MRKKALLLIRETLPPAPEKFTAAGERYLAVAQAAFAGCKEILNIDLYAMRGFPEEKVHLVARYYADIWNNSFTTYIPDEKEWKAAGIDNIIHYLMYGYMDQNGNYRYRQNEHWKYASKKDEKLVNSFLKAAGDYHSRIQSWENSIRSDRYYTAQSRKQSRINDMMDEKVPLIPEGFYTWMHETVFGRDYLYQKKTGEKYCTACGKEWSGDTVKAGYISCPKCGKKVLATFQASHESKEEQLFLLQRCEGDTGEWIERTFRAKAFWEFGQKRFIRWDEQIRIIIPEGEHLGKCFYEIGIRGDTGEYSDRNTYQKRIRKGYLYPDNLDETRPLWAESLRHSGIDILARQMIRINFNKMIMYAGNRPYMEYLIKGRFWRLTAEILNESAAYRSNMLLTWNVRSPQDLMKVGPSQVDRLRQQNGGFIMLSWLQYEYQTGKKLTKENMEYLQKHGVSALSSNMQTALKYMSPNTLVNYLRRQMQQSGESFFEGMLNTYCDYLDMAKKQKLNLSHEIFYKPKDLRAAHDECVLEGKKHEMDIRAAEIQEKFPDILKNMDMIRDKYTYVGETFCIVVPERIQDILREGRSLGHCIDTTDRYFDRINQNISYLVFLRRTEHKDKPYYTLEIEPGGTVRQQRTTGNNQNREEVEEYTPFIREWQQEVRKRLTDDDRQQAEISKNVRLQEYAELRQKQEKVWHGKLAGQLLADVLEGDLIENAG